jgi:hypothetical protein
VHGIAAWQYCSYTAFSKREKGCFMNEKEKIETEMAFLKIYAGASERSTLASLILHEGQIYHYSEAGSFR